MSSANEPFARSYWKRANSVLPHAGLVGCVREPHSAIRRETRLHSHLQQSSSSAVDSRLFPSSAQTSEAVSASRLRRKTPTSHRGAQSSGTRPQLRVASVEIMSSPTSLGRGLDHSRRAAFHGRTLLISLRESGLQIENPRTPSSRSCAGGRVDFFQSPFGRGSSALGRRGWLFRRGTGRWRRGARARAGAAGCVQCDRARRILAAGLLLFQ